LHEIFTSQQLRLIIVELPVFVKSIETVRNSAYFAFLAMIASAT
jgi:hypothetical protein